MSELKRENVEENGHTLGENLEYLRAVYCVHPMVIEVLDMVDALMKERDALRAERDAAVSMVDSIVPCAVKFINALRIGDNKLAHARMLELETWLDEWRNREAKE